LPHPLQIKSAGFLAGLFGLFIAATKRGWILKIFMGLAVMGGVFFAAVWLVIAATGQFTLVYVLGEMWYQMIAPCGTRHCVPSHAPRSLVDRRVGHSCGHSELADFHAS
jgi:hypothetical protein